MCLTQACLNPSDMLVINRPRFGLFRLQRHCPRWLALLQCAGKVRRQRQPATFVELELVRDSIASTDHTKIKMIVAIVMQVSAQLKTGKLMNLVANMSRT